MIQLRPATVADYAPIVSVVDAWWGRPMSAMLPRLFFEYFSDTSLIAEASGERIGFVVGFMPPTPSADAYVHFVGVHPDYRHAGVGRALYEAFFDLLAARTGRGFVVSRHRSTSVPSPSTVSWGSP